MIIKKVKYWSKVVQNDVVDHVNVSYTKDNQDIVLHDFGNNSTAAPELYKYFDDLSPFVCLICGINKKLESAISVRDVSISPSEDKEGDDNTKYTIVSSLKAGTANATLTVSVNHKYIPEGFDDAINDLIVEAEEYVNGKRAQTALDLPESEAQNDPDESELPEDEEYETDEFGTENGIEL